MKLSHCTPEAYTMLYVSNISVTLGGKKSEMYHMLGGEESAERPLDSACLTPLPGGGLKCPPDCLAWHRPGLKELQSSAMN